MKTIGSETQAQTLLIIDLDQISKFVYILSGPLGKGNIQRSNSQSDIHWILQYPSHSLKTKVICIRLSIRDIGKFEIV
jgi:hypothetical protein